MTARPSWVVLAPVDELTARRAVRDAEAGWRVLAGRGAYLAIVELEPGAVGAGDDELAGALSRAVAGDCYALWTDVDLARVAVFRGGVHVGDLAAAPDDVAAHVGCTFPGARPRYTLDAAALTPIPPPTAASIAADDVVIAGSSTAVWGHAMRTIAGWQDAIIPSPAMRPQLAVALRHPRAEVRRVAAHLAGAVGRELATLDLIAMLDEIARDDADAEVRRAAAESADALREWHA